MTETTFFNIFFSIIVIIIIQTIENPGDDSYITYTYIFNVGANDYLTKPFSKEELLSRIKTHLNLHRINMATGKFVPSEFIRSLGKEAITEVQLGDQVERNVTVFFSDIRDYTTLAEQMTPEQNFKFVNAFNGRMGPIILENNGFINQ